MPRILLRLLPLLAASSCLPAITGGVEIDPPTGDGIHVLFVGNSLTYFNSLPEIVQALSDSAGVGPIRSRTVAFPDYSLEDHWSEGSARRAIAKGGWHYVVLQQGPSAASDSRVLLIDYAERFDAEIRKKGGAPALYSVWPQASRSQDFARASESYALAAEAVDGVFLGVADAWQAAWRRDPSLALYASDGLHPTPLGSYLAALVIYAKLTDRSPLGLPHALRLESGGTIAIPPTTAALLQEAAAEVTATTPAR